jgi:phosphatidylglycerol:prolipoprotein diacylglycerol transferase
LWDGQSSFGGFAGALLGAYGFAKRYRLSILPYADVIASALPTGWVLGRLGCSLVHDHPGRASELWLATAYPGGGRVDLGFWEMAMTFPLAAAFLLLRRRPRPPGFYLAVLALAYAPIRCGLDFLRATEVSWPDVPVVDPRYGPFTPAQWGCWAVLGLGLWLFWQLARTIAGPRWVDEALAPPTRLSLECR